MQVFLWVSIIFTILFALFEPFGKRLWATGLWLGKALVSPDLATVSPRGMQDSLTSGAISNITFAINILPYLIFAIGFIYSWWLPFLSYFLYIITAAIARNTAIASRTVDYYLAYILAAMGRRQADYLKDGDTERAEIMSELIEAVTPICELYLASGIPAPSSRIVRNSPFGDPEYLFTVSEK